MDPNETLKQLRERAKLTLEHGTEYDSDPLLAELFTSLDDWLRKGGFLPDGWSAPCRQQPASAEAVLKVLHAPFDDDGRGEWQWIRLPNGDLCLAVFPMGDTYIDVSEQEGV